MPPCVGVPFQLETNGPVTVMLELETNIVHLPGYGWSPLAPSPYDEYFPMIYAQYICPPFLSFFRTLHMFLLFILPTPAPPPLPASTPAVSKTPLTETPLFGIPKGSI